MGYVSIWHWLIVLIVLFVPYIPAYFALKKIGKPGWHFILMGIPIIGFIYHWYLMKAEWKNTDEEGRVILNNEMTT